jgi:ATP-binding cassette subfamily B protein
VSDNIRYGNIDAQGTDDEIMQAAVHGGADEFIRKLPFGYETIMGRSFDNGHELSVGQWQKLAISRAFYSPARFIIMDEATSALDALAERELFDRFREKIGNRTALIVSHRVSAVEHADYIYVFSEGQIRQQGTHYELLKQEGEYARLFKKPEKEMSS